MANTLTAIVNSVYTALTTAPKQVRGVLDAISADLDATPVDIGQPLVVPVVGVKTSTSWAPRMYESSATDTTPTAISLSLAGAESDFNLSDADRNNLLRTGDAAYESFFQQNIQEALAANSATVGAAAITALKQGAARASGTAGTTPFASDTTALENAMYNLKLNGAPMVDLVAVLSAAAWRNFRALGIVQQASLNGGDARKTGMLGKEAGFEMYEDFGISSHTKGTATGEDVNITTALALNATTIPCDGSNSGTVLAGDIITFAGDTGDPDAGAWKYVVSGLTANTLSGAAAGNIYIGRPGVQVAYTDTTELTIGANYTPCFCLSKSALKAVVRPVACAVGGQVVGVSVIQDQYGMPATLIEVKGTGMSKYSVVQAYGFKVIKPYAVHTILG